MNGVGEGIPSVLVVGVVAALGGSDCEQLRAGWLAQPANAVSSLAYVVVGVWLLWRSRRPGVHRGVLVAGGLGLVAVGVGSLAYHGPQPGWAHVAHDGSIVWVALVLVGRSIRLTARAGVAAAVAAWKAAAPWLVVALAAYVAGRTGSPLCHPGSLWQPHAAWHGLSAVGLGSAVVGSSRRRLRDRPRSAGRVRSRLI